MGELIKATTKVCEAHLHQAYTPCVIGASPSQTCMVTNIHPHRFVIELVQRQRVGEDELQRPPLVALTSKVTLHLETL